MRRMRSALAAALLSLLVLAAPARAASTDPAAALPAATAIPPLVRQGNIERHTAETLWERIDGEAELYRSYGLSASAHARYEDPAQPDRSVTVSVFSFTDPLGAFGLFAAFRSPESAVQSWGNGGCVGDYQGFFWQGDLFVLADAAGPPSARLVDLRGALQAVAAALGPPPARPEPLRAFSRFADTHTIRYQPLHLLGREPLPPGLEGLAGGTPIFVSTGAVGSERIAAALDAYERVLEGAVRGERHGFTVLSGRDPFLGPVTILGGRDVICGARSAPETPRVRELLEDVAGHGGDPALEGAW